MELRNERDMGNTKSWTSGVVEICRYVRARVYRVMEDVPIWKYEVMERCWVMNLGKILSYGVTEGRNCRNMTNVHLEMYGTFVAIECCNYKCCEWSCKVMKYAELWTHGLLTDLELWSYEVVHECGKQIYDAMKIQVYVWYRTAHFKSCTRFELKSGGVVTRVKF